MPLEFYHATFDQVVLKHEALLKVWDGVNNKDVAWVTPGGDPSLLGRMTKMAGQTLFPFASRSRIYTRGHIPTTGKVAASLASLARVIAPDNPKTKPEAIALYRKVSRYLTSRIIDSLTPELVDENPHTEYERLRQAMPNKPTSHIVSLLEARELRRTLGLNAPNDKAKPFPKMEDSSKVESDYQEGEPLKPRAIFPMTMEEALDHVQVLHACKLIYKSDQVTRWQVKSMTPAQVTARVYAITGGAAGPIVNTDYSSFENFLTAEIAEAEVEAISAVMDFMGAHEAAEKYRRDKAKKRTYHGLLSFIHRGRCSGDYITAGGNWLANLTVCLVQSFSKFRETGGDDMDRWWATAEHLPMVMEGDDAVVPLELVDVRLVSDLGLKFSLSVQGEEPNSVDFLRVMHMDGCKVVNVLRSLRSLWTICPQRLKPSKLGFLSRAVAWNMWCTSPGHPILCAAVEAIGKATKGVSAFKGAERYLITHPGKPEIVMPPDRFPKTFVCPKLREALASSTNPQVPAVPIPVQEAVERVFREWRPGVIVDVDVVFAEYPEHGSMVTGPLQPQLAIGGDMKKEVAYWLRILGSL